MIVYVKHQGSVIGRQGQALIVRKDDFKQTIFTHRLEQLVLMGAVSVTPPALNLLFWEEIDTVFLTRNGNYKGRLESSEGKNVFLHRRQFETLGEPGFAPGIARAVVAGKLNNMATLLGRLRRRGKKNDTSALDRGIQGIRSLIQRCGEAADLSVVRGFEGQGSRLFFEGLRAGFRDDWHFRKRVRRPPTDPVNSVLSLLYTLLFNRVHAAARLAGLNPMVGYLHTLDYGRYSLVLDLMEEFRSLVAETATLSLFNLRILDRDDFFYEEPPERTEEQTVRAKVTDDPLGVVYENPDDGFFEAPEQRIEEEGFPEHEPSGKRPCRLTPEALKRVLGAFENKVNTEFTHPTTGTSVNYAEAMVVQARRLRAVIEGEQAVYQPLQMK